jgi:uncharacterized SAM-binding protein YcdF (DUF218 family)
MFVYLTKIVWALLSPLSLTLILSALGLVLVAIGWRRTGIASGTLGLLILALSTCTNFGEVLIAPLENRFVRVAEPAHIDGIVVLGGGMDQAVNTVRKGWELKYSGDRFVETLRLALTHPEAKLVLSGGVAVTNEGEEPEADAAARFYRAFGIAADRLIIEPKSRNTEENAQFSKELAAPKPGETWLLVTSAFHMPRSMALFRRAGFEVIAWPADYMSAGNQSFALSLGDASDKLVTTNLAVREWAGLVGYWLAGKIDSVFPAP